MNKYLMTSLLIIGLASPPLQPIIRPPNSPSRTSGMATQTPAGRCDFEDTAMPKRGLVLKAASRVTITTTDIGSKGARAAAGSLVDPPRRPLAAQ